MDSAFLMRILSIRCSQADSSVLLRNTVRSFLAPSSPLDSQSLRPPSSHESIQAQPTLATHEQHGDIRRPLLLDTRPRADYWKRHIDPSTNIPLKRLDHSWFQLPPKQTPFAVLEPSPLAAARLKGAPPAAVGNGSRDRKPSDDHPGQSMWTTESPSEVLKSRGWTVPWVFEDRDEFWSLLKEELDGQRHGGITTATQPSNVRMKVVENGTQNQDTTKHHFLFRPNPVLVKILPWIERELVRVRQQQLGRQRQQGDNSGKEDQEGSRLLRCLDMGCGSGRDMVYMVAREPNKEGAPGAAWTVLGVDQRLDACERTLQLAKETFCHPDDNEQEETRPAKKKEGSEGRGGGSLDSRISTVAGKVDATTGQFWIAQDQPLPPHNSIGGDFMNARELKRNPLVLPNVRSHDPERDKELLVLNAGDQERSWEDHFDLIIMIRFLQRPLISPMVQHWLRPGGFILLSTFVSDPDLPPYSKPGSLHRLQSKAEAREIFEGLGLKVVMDEISLAEDGLRSIATVVAQKPLEHVVKSIEHCIVSDRFIYED